MRMRISVTFVFVVFSLALVSTASAQTPFGPPDERYSHRVEGQRPYPASLVPKFESAPTQDQLVACAGQKPYEPADTHLYRYVSRVKVARIRVQETDECTGMRTAAGDKLVLRPKGTKVAVDELDRDLFDFGSPNGAVCGNARVFSIPVNIPPPPAVIEEPALMIELPPRPEPPAPRVRRPRPLPPLPPPVAVREKEEGIIYQIGTGIIAGPVKTTYEYPDPNRGNVPQRHKMFAPVLTAQVDQSSQGGFFGSLTTSFAGSAWGMKLQDITGAWSGKSRDDDDSRDKLLRLSGGYKFPLGDVVSVGVGLSYDRFCLCEKYFAQNTNTVTKRSYRTLGLSVEATAATESRGLVVRVEGTLGLTGKREKWTKQNYQGPPPIDFPRIVDQRESAKLHRLGAEADIRIAGPVRGFVGVSWSRWDSKRPIAHPAQEHTRIFGLTFGIRLGN
ncbi:MAG: hypothetical protein HY395_02960 [Candidatus Doudnabacteria bacterium]|nr:hypothetical protein [Candidatus Doudnabacteria bacterium]